MQDRSGINYTTTVTVGFLWGFSGNIAVGVDFDTTQKRWNRKISEEPEQNILTQLHAASETLLET